jgi:8-oxo-dGTP pyrophosphatase MutT (NUDIX family)
MEKDVKKEKSCGGVVFIMKDGMPLFLIEHSNYGHYSLPKGHVERGEDDISCAKREIKEETNLDVSLIPGFANKISYFPFKNVYKDVFYYLFRCFNIDCVKPQETEIKDIIFLPFDKAYTLLTFGNDQEVLLDARMFIEGLHL